MKREEKPTVLIVHNYYQFPGGEDTVVENEKKNLEDNGHKVFLYTRSNSELKTFKGWKKLLLPFNTIFSIKTYMQVSKIIKTKNIDIIHVHNTLNLISPSVYYAAFYHKIPVVQTIHNFRLLCPAATFYRSQRICEDCIDKGLGNAIKYKCYRNSRIQTLACVINLYIHRMLGTYKKLNYICLTDFNKSKLLKFSGINENRIFIKPNFVVENHWQVVPYKSRKNQFVFAGRIDDIKGIKTLLVAWKKMGNLNSELIICGSGPQEKWCQNYINENKMENVKMLGFVSNQEVKQIISNSKAVIFPTQWYEGFPMVIVEAYSVGTPVIGSDIGNVNSLIIDHLTGHKFKHNSPDALVEAVEKIGDMVDSTKKNHEKNYTSEKNYNFLLKIYLDLLRQ